MKEFKYVTTDYVEIHTRHSWLIVSTAKKYNCAISLKQKDKVLGSIIQKGSTNSHATILAKNRNIPT